MRADAFRARRDVEGAGHAATARMIAMLSTASSSTTNELSILSNGKLRKCWETNSWCQSHTWRFDIAAVGMSVVTGDHNDNSRQQANCERYGPE
jgi:hypothetical protein